MEATRARRWTDEELGFLQDHPELTSRQVGELLNRGAQAALIMRRKLARGWTPEREVFSASEDEFILASPHLTAAEVGRHLGRSVQSVHRRRRALSKTRGFSSEKPWTIGRRTLIARTCPRCGLLLDASWYRPCGGGWTTYCTRCKDRSIDKRVDRARGSSQRLQQLSLPHAHRHGMPWLTSDHEVLSDPSLSVFEKAILLQRTYHATHQQASLNGYKNKVGLGDATKGQWVIKPANAA